MAFDTAQDSYLRLRSIYAERSDQIVAWVGAGISRAAGMPSWFELREVLVQAVIKLAAQDPATKNDLETRARAAEEEQDLWIAFNILKKALGPQTYTATIRHAFRDSERAAVPEAYKTLWKLGITGLLNLNIDRLATRAYNEVYPGQLLHDFSGYAIKNHVHLLKSDRPWQANLHGVLDDVSSWVFTSADFERLRQTAGYLDFIKTCFFNRTVVFMGISADDVAAGGHLEVLTQAGIDCGSHFWITHLGPDKRSWAEDAGIQIIHYNTAGSNHSELRELLDDLQSFVPRDDTPLPIVATKINRQVFSLPSPDQLEGRSAAEIRSVLNDHASQLLEHTTPESVASFERFAQLYSEAIYRAWYVSIQPPKNSILGYELTEKCAEGAFGSVYRARNSNGDVFAVKILHERIRNSPEMLQSFRRGVRSMRILTDANLAGVVKYYDASEIPAMVAMDFIEGIDVAEAVNKRVLQSWERVLDVATWLSSVIRSSHRLPQRVLHRDIRPSNIMLENCWGGGTNWEDVKLWVLDFDLSYHLDAFDVSVTQPGTANGYLAPEQSNRNSGVSTRNAAVDSFGIGMTLYFLRTGVEPQFSEHLHGDWLITLRNGADNNKCSRWQSLPMRYFRLIKRATRDKQAERLDMAAIDSELVRLKEALHSPATVESAELLAEEIAAQVFNDYEWNTDRLEASMQIGGTRVVLRGDEKALNVVFEFSWLQTQNEVYPSVRKWLPRASERISSILSKSGWNATSTIETGSIRGNATISVRALSRNFGSSAHAIREALSQLEF